MCEGMSEHVCECKNVCECVKVGTSVTVHECGKVGEYALVNM